MMQGLAVAMLALTGTAQAVAPAPVPAPPPEEASVRNADSAFWRAFNACDAASMAALLAEDVEFYHDITGLTRSRKAVTASLMKGPCGKGDLQLRRELVAPSARYQRIPGYGAILSGEHVFHARNGNGPERAETQARFMVIWKHQAGRWAMARVVSYDHQPAPYRPSSASIELPSAALARYVGRYETGSSDDIRISLENDRLVLQSGNLRLALAASAPDQFFAQERDLRFTFSAHPAPLTVTVIEKGAVVATGAKRD